MMSIKEMVNEMFPTPTIEEWVQKGEAALKGKSIDSLSKSTYEEIVLKPLYTREDQNLQGLSQFPGQEDLRRGINALGQVSQDWKVAQKISAETVEDLKTKLASSFNRGQTAISFEVVEQLIPSVVTMLEDFHSKYPYSLNGKGLHKTLLNELSGISSSEQGTGYIGKDPLGHIVEQGATVDTIENEYNELAESVVKAIETFPNIRTILVDTTPYHNGGANAVQELAIALCTGVFHIEELLKRGLSLETVLSKLVFQFSIGANFFMEVAKLRAARILWNKITEAYGAAEEDRGMIISAETSSFTKTVYDPYVNMLRAGNEAFAAVLGGVQYLHVNPFDEPALTSSDFATRIARNTQLILKEEAHLTKTVDPAGGSWYVEALTNELSEKGLGLFVEIEDKGGIVEALKQGWLQEQIAAIMKKRETAIHTRKQTIVGTNKYANLQDQPLNVIANEGEAKKDASFISPIPQRRLSEAYEQLRAQAKQLEDNEMKPAVGLLTLGKLKEFKTRADFITGFVAPGGIETVSSGELETSKDALVFIRQSNLKYFCLCGSNEQYETVGLQFVQEIKNEFPHIQLYLAGLPENGEQQEWIDNGIKQFIHVRSNCYEALSSLLNEMEARDHE